MARCHFLNDDSGAVTVDWVIMTAAVVGLGLAASLVVSSGVENLAGDVDGQLRGNQIFTGFQRQGYFDDFESGPGRWVGGGTDNSDAAYGGVLGRFGGTGGAEVVSRSYDLMSGYDYAVIEFDLHAIDSWDAESFIVFANGEPVGSYRFNHRAEGVQGEWAGAEGVDFSITQTSGLQHTGYSPTWPDQSFSVRMEVANPGDEITIGYGSTLNQSLDDESWAIDDVRLTSTNDPGQV